MTENNAVTGIYPTHSEAEAAVKALQRAGFDMQNRRYIMLCMALPCEQRSRQAHGNRLRHDLEVGRVTE